jgi:hypothetical protein
MNRLTAAGIAVLVIRDVPGMSQAVPTCLAANSDPPACDTPRSVAVQPEPLAGAATADTSGLVSVWDPTDLLCDATMCHAVIGGLMVYRDDNHLAPPFTRTLAPVLADAISGALRPARP